MYGSSKKKPTSRKNEVGFGKFSLCRRLLRNFEDPARWGVHTPASSSFIRRTDSRARVYRILRSGYALFRNEGSFRSGGCAWVGPHWNKLWNDGQFVVTRKLSLFGDTLSHAVLPGIAIGFLWAESKDNLALLLGASFAGFLGVACISLLKKFTKISQDSALGIVLSGFYAVGICMLTRIQKMDFGNQSGLDTYLFGQVSALSTNDLIGVWRISCSHYPIHNPELQGVADLWVRPRVRPLGQVARGYLAISALGPACLLRHHFPPGGGSHPRFRSLIIPAASASLLAKRMSSYLCIAASLGAISGLVGAFLSFLGERLPTGPLIVLTASFLFFTDFGFSTPSWDSCLLGQIEAAKSPHRNGKHP